MFGSPPSKKIRLPDLLLRYAVWLTYFCYMLCGCFFLWYLQVCLIYVERLMETAQVPLLASTWKPVLLCGLLLASKVRIYIYILNRSNFLPAP